MPMPPFEALSSLNRLVHEPARLAILTALAGCRSADFMFLLSLTGLSRGNLSGHLAKLEHGGLIRIEKGFKGKVPHTTVALTDEGRHAIDAHWTRLTTLGQQARDWRSDDAESET
jgi:DNA-binding transcriptional ArsR family regulator